MAARFPGSDRNKNGFGSVALIAHVGDDIGDIAQLARRPFVLAEPAQPTGPMAMSTARMPT